MRRFKPKDLDVLEKCIREAEARTRAEVALVIRGSSPGDSQVVFEGGPVDRLYHFGGLTSFTSSRLLEHIRTARCDHDACSVLRERERAGFADAFTTAGDDGYLCFESELHVLLWERL